MDTSRTTSRRRFLRSVGASATLLSGAAVGAMGAAGAESAGTVVFIYDDSASENYTKTFPVHRELDAPASLAVNTGALGTQGNLSEAQLTEIADAGWEIMSHTVEHRPVGAYPLVRDAEPGDTRVFPLANNHGKIPGDRVRIFDGAEEEQATVAGYGSVDSRSEDDEYVELEEPLQSGFGAESAQISFTEPVVRSALADSKADLEAMGFTVTNFVYPHGNKSERARELVPEYYDAVANGRWVDGLNERDGLDPYRLHRSYYRPGRMTEAELETKFDRMVPEDVVGILAAHSGNERFTADRARLAIEMARERNVEIRTLREVLVDLGHAEPVQSTTATPTPTASSTTTTADPSETGTATATTGGSGALTDQLAGVGVASALAGVGLGGWRYLRE
ncbi:polysaccharide deacetylase family protein [Halobacteriales archaeon Cl-PHB]